MCRTRNVLFSETCTESVKRRLINEIELLWAVGSSLSTSVQITPNSSSVREAVRS